MSDDLKNKGPQDRARINLHEEHEVRYWTKKFGVTEDELKKARGVGGGFGRGRREEAGEDGLGRPNLSFDATRNLMVV
jgi:hypothetical protein